MDPLSATMREAGEGDDARIELALSLIDALRVGDEPEVSRLLDALGARHERSLFDELGRLTRQLHDALNSFRLDPRVAGLTEKDIPDAKERLGYVVTLTEQSANKTLNVVEDVMPRISDLKERAANLGATWQRFMHRKLPVEAFREFTGDLNAFLNDIERESGTIGGQLSEIMLAQDFQDITGQVIRRVIELVQEVETQLVNLIRGVGAYMSKTDNVLAHDTEQASLPVNGLGPVVPGVDQNNVVSSQDEVDDLLSSLGF
jgi:chemotaxis protein CheZ